jgi:hypothetical protein
MGWGDPDGSVRCEICGADWWPDAPGRCRYHPGRLMDGEREGMEGSGRPGDFWSCCGQRFTRANDWVPGCALGIHGLSEEDMAAAEAATEAATARVGVWHRACEAPSITYSDNWSQPERVEEARWRVRRWLAGRLKHRDWEKELAARDVHVLENADSTYLLDQLGSDRYVTERRRFIAARVTIPELADQARRAAG